MDETTTRKKRKEPDHNDDTKSRPGICKKLRDLEGEINENQRTLEEMEARHNEGSDKEIIESLRQLRALERELNSLEKGFLKGEYFAATSAYWKTVTQENIKEDKNAWTNFVRSPTDVQAPPFECRHCVDEHSALETNNPYETTKNAAEDPFTSLPVSISSRTSSSTQKNETFRNKIWPTDIFGIKARKQRIAHLLPAGKDFHKEWINVAAAVVGLKDSSSIVEKKKATRGVQETPMPSSDGNTRVEYEGSASRKNQKRKRHTGVVHFVSNKIRLQGQGTILDGDEPQGLLVPVMTFEDAKKWRGKEYTAIFILGQPAGNFESDTSTISDCHIEVRLNDSFLTKHDLVKDATSTEIECARVLLERAFLALRAMIANLKDDEIENLELAWSDGVKEARDVARRDACILPACVEPTSDRKPVCLLTFGGSKDGKMHPAPDPLLLVLKAANIWGKMTNQRMLTNGQPPQIHANMTEGDGLAEMAYYEAKFGPLVPARPETWEDLAAGLGQLNGYCP